MPKVICKKVVDLTPKEYQACYRANFGSNGSMQGELAYCRQMKFLSWAVMIWVDGHLASWALIFPSWDDRRSEAYFFTKIRHRRKGYAYTIGKYIQQYFVPVEVYPGTEANTRLFNKLRNPKRELATRRMLRSGDNNIV